MPSSPDGQQPTPRLRRRSTLLGLLALGGCAQPQTAPAPASAQGPAPSRGTRIAILLPLSGRTAEIGQAMLRGAQLALDGREAPPFDQFDTGASPTDAVAAARKAIEAGAGILLGPLTAGDTLAVAPAAQAAGLPVLSFSSDLTVARPGLWPLGIAPAQQVRRLVRAVQAENKVRLAAVVPNNLFGQALADGLLAATREAGMPPPAIERAAATFSGFDEALKRVSDYAARRPGIESRRQSPAPGAPPAPDPASGVGLPFDALLLGATGPLLAQVTPLLAAYEIGPAQVRILGPATWAREAIHLQALIGAWYAAPETRQRLGFEQRYQARFHAPPSDFASLAFDAAGIARSAASGQGFPVAALTRPQGYAGADGLIALLPDGTVRRGLAVYEVGRAGPRIVSPAPASLAGPGS